MRIIYEEDIENEDFLEIILTSLQVERLPGKGLIKVFPFGLTGNRKINVYIRIDDTHEDDYATS